MPILKRIRKKTSEYFKEIFSYHNRQFDTVLDYDVYWRSRRNNTEPYIGWLQKERLKKVISIAQSNSIHSVLDVGGGDGSFLFFLKKELSGINVVTCADKAGIQLAKANSFGINTIEIDISKNNELSRLPKADLVLALEVIEHVPNSENVLEHLFKASNKMVILSFPNTAFLTYRLRLLFGRTPAQWAVHPAEHLRYWSFKDAEWWLSKLGYKNFKLLPHRGIPGLNRLMPNLFSDTIFVVIRKD